MIGLPGASSKGVWEELSLRAQSEEEGWGKGIQRF